MLPLLGLLLLGLLLSRQDPAAMLAAAARVSPTTLLVAAAAFTANVCVKALRWHRLLAAQGHPLPASVSLAAYLSGQFYGHVTLGRLGEFYRAEALTTRGVPAGRALSSCLVDRLFDLALVLALGGGLAVFVLGRQQVWLSILTVCAMGLFAGLCLWLARPRGSSRAPTAATTRAGALWRRFRRLVRDLWTGSAELMRPAPVLEASCWTCLGWLGHFAGLWLIAEGMGLSADRLLLTTAACMGSLSALLPLTVSGLGARELLYAEILGRQGVTAEAAIVLSLLHLSMMTVLAIGLGFPGVLWRRHQQASGETMPRDLHDSSQE